MFFHGGMPVDSSSVLCGVSGNARTLSPGQVVFARFSLQRLIGKGGMGMVWLAHDSQLDRQVALKFMADAHLQEPGASEELRRETRRSLELTHPNVIRIYDYLEDENAAAISLEYVDGPTLARLRVEQRDGIFEPADLAGWLLSCCEALEYAHQHACIVHRDLKPSNILISSRNVAKIGDFGISCGLQNTAARISAWSGATGGTLGYMSPQQLRGDLASPSDDIYSFGATIYELLTGKPPFFTGDISYQVREIEPESVDERRAKFGISRPPIPADWTRTIASCLAKEPEDRPGSIAEIAERLGLKGNEGRQMGTASDLDRTLRFAPLHRRTEPTPLKRRMSFNQWFAVAVIVPVITGWFLWPDTSGNRVGKADAAEGSKAEPKPAEPIQSVEAPIVSTVPGGILIKTNPPGATVILAGKSVGVTPLTVNEIPAGEHSIGMELPGFELKTLPATVKSREFTDLGTVPLERSVGALLVQTEPQDSAYVLFSDDGTREIRRGRTPEQIPGLPTGKYRLRFERSGWPASDTSVEVKRQATEMANHRFGVGHVDITTDPPGAEIRLGEQRLGTSPIRVELPAGEHRGFTAYLAGYRQTEFAAKAIVGEVTVVPPLVLAAEAPALGIVTDPPAVEFELFAGAVVMPDAVPLREGTTPARLEGLAPGRYTVVFNSPPWPVSSRSVELGPRGTTDLQHDFAAGTVEVTAQPEGAIILVNGKEIGQAPLEVMVPTGTYEVSAEYKGKSARVRTIELGADETETIRFDFTTSTSTRSRTKRPKKENNVSMFTKVGRSIHNFFSGDKRRR